MFRSGATATSRRLGGPGARASGHMSVLPGMWAGHVPSLVRQSSNQEAALWTAATCPGTAWPWRAAMARKARGDRRCRTGDRHGRPLNDMYVLPEGVGQSADGAVDHRGVDVHAGDLPARPDQMPQHAAFHPPEPISSIRSPSRGARRPSIPATSQGADTELTAVPSSSRSMKTISLPYASAREISGGMNQPRRTASKASALGTQPAGDAQLRDQVRVQDGVHTVGSVLGPCPVAQCPMSRSAARNCSRGEAASVMAARSRQSRHHPLTGACPCSAVRGPVRQEEGQRAGREQEPAVRCRVQGIGHRPPGEFEVLLGGREFLRSAGEVAGFVEVDAGG